jgi:Protein of unknown function (DUF4199)
MKTALKYGVAFGLATCAWTLVEYALGFHTTRIAAGHATEYLALVLPLTFIVLAGVAERRNLGIIGVGRALAIAFVVMLVGDAITTPFLWAYHHYILPDWMDRQIAFERERLILQGIAAAEIDRRLAAMAMSASTAAQVIGGLVGSSFVALIVGLPMGFILRRSSRPRSFGGTSTAAA